MEQQTKTNLLNPETWIRLLYMMVFGLLSVLARMVVWVVAVLQFLLVLVTGRDNKNLRELGQGASKWTYQAFLFVTFNSDDKPFPFSDWPEVEGTEEHGGIADILNGEGNTTEATAIDDVPTFVNKTEEAVNESLDEKRDKKEFESKPSVGTKKNTGSTTSQPVSDYTKSEHSKSGDKT